MNKGCLFLVGLLICASGYAQELEKFFEGGKYGFCDANGNVVIPAKYYGQEETVFSEGLARVQIDMGGKYGYIDKTGKEVIPIRYRVAGIFSEGLANVCLDYGEKYGYIVSGRKRVYSCISERILYNKS